MNRLIRYGCLVVLVCLHSMTVQADVEPVCIERFTNAGAVPGTASCVNDAVTSPAGLSNFGCTANLAIAEEFCGITVQEQETGPCPDGRLRNYDTMQCPEPVRRELEQYEPDNDDNPCPTPLEEIPNLPGPVQFITQGLQFHPSSSLTNLSLVTSGISGINLVSAIKQTQDTGDTRPTANALVGITLPLLNVAFFQNMTNDFLSVFDGRQSNCP